MMLSESLQALIRDLPLYEDIQLGDDSWQDHRLRLCLVELGLVKRKGSATLPQDLVLYKWSQSGRAIKIMLS